MAEERFQLCKIAEDIPCSWLIPAEALLLQWRIDKGKVCLFQICKPVVGGVQNTSGLPRNFLDPSLLFEWWADFEVPVWDNYMNLTYIDDYIPQPGLALEIHAKAGTIVSGRAIWSGAS